MDQIIIFCANYLIVVVAIISLISFFRATKHKKLEFAVQAIISAIVAMLLTKLGGSLINDPRPFTHGVRSLIPHAPDNGFPSDHTTLSLVMAGLAMSKDRILGSLALLFAFVVGVARIAAGVHSPLDISGSTCIAAMSLGMAALVERKLNRGGQSDRSNSA